MIEIMLFQDIDDVKMDKYTIRIRDGRKLISYNKVPASLANNNPTLLAKYLKGKITKVTIP